MGTTRRRFLTGVGAVSAMGLAGRRLRGQDGLEAKLAARLANDPRRPQFHLLPAKNWMNDPNGPIYFKGKYHMFFQYNPLAAVWGDMSWYHAVSPDMIHWRSLPVAFTPTPGSADSFGCFSGSALRVGERVYQVYTGTQKSGEELATIRDGANDVRETQCLAYSDDAGLVKWTKVAEPVIPMPPKGMKITGFRDPSAWKQGDWYYMTVGSGEAQVGGCVLLYRSKDLKSWEYLHKLTSGEWNGKKTANPCDDGEMWECPDFFALDGGHVLIYSTLGKVFWESGKLDEATMTFRAAKRGLLDLDAFYAPKTQMDAAGRRILWGWVPERRSQDAMREAGWSGMMSLPRVLRLDADGTLRMQVLPAMAALRAGVVRAAGDGGVTIGGACGEFVCGGKVGEAMSLTVSDGEKELLNVKFVPERHVFVADGKEFALEAGDVPRVHGFVDGSVIEVMLSERIGYTKRFYYPGATAPDLAVKASRAGGVTLSGWKIAPISQDRLTGVALRA